MDSILTNPPSVAPRTPPGGPAKPVAKPRAKGASGRGGKGGEPDGVGTAAGVRPVAKRAAVAPRAGGVQARIDQHVMGNDWGSSAKSSGTSFAKGQQSVHDVLNKQIWK